MCDDKETYYEFGPFRLYPLERALKCGGAPVKLANKPYEILLIFLRSRGRVVTTQELNDAIWADEAVEPNTLNVHIAALRHALKGVCPEASEYIKNVPRVGYRFTAPVKECGVPTTAAVLPFKIEGAEKVPDDIGREMADTLTTMLNKNQSINVTPSPTINSEYSQHPEQRPLIFGHRLGVDYVFSGRIWRERDKMRVNVDFLDVRSDQPRASNSFQGKHAQSFEVDTAIYNWMASVMNLTPSEQEAEQSAKLYTENEKAHDFYRKGRVQRFEVSEPSLRKAIYFFKLAAKEDPNYARAYANIAETYIFMGMLNLITPQESYEGASAAAAEALRLDPSMASAHTMWAFTELFFERRWDEARDGFRRAIEINPNYPVAHMGYAHLLTAEGAFAEAVTEINRALALDQYSFFINFVRGMVFFQARQYDRAVEQFEQTQVLNLRFNLKSDLSHYGSSLAHEYLALASEGSVRKKMFEKADQEARRAITLANRHPLKLMQRVHVRAAFGKSDEAWEMLEEVFNVQRDGHYVSPYHLGAVYVALGKKDLAVRCLKEAHRDKDMYLFLLGVDPRFDDLRPDGRLRKLL